ncbi:hypothetical protein JCM8547_000943 [Rhodosporidiobolus lusitaniae]
MVAVDPLPQPLGECRPPATRTVSFPVDLPASPSLRKVDWDALELDDDLRAVPLNYTQDVLRGLGHLLMQGAAETLVHHDQLPPPKTSSPRATCTPPSSPLPHPSYVLDISFHDCQQRHFIPIHGIVFSLLSPALAAASSTRTITTSEGLLLLPLIPLALPSKSAWHALHDFIYTGSSASLLSCLLQSPEKLAGTASFSFRLRRIRALWQTAVALEIGEPALWTTMRRAWSALVKQARGEAADETDETDETDEEGADEDEEGEESEEDEGDDSA